MCQVAITTPCPRLHRILTAGSTTVALSLVFPAVKSKIREVFCWPGWYTVSTYKRETAIGLQERKHHENSHFQRRHCHRVRSVGSGTRAHPGGWRPDHACRLVPLAAHLAPHFSAFAYDR